MFAKEKEGRRDESGEVVAHGLPWSMVDKKGVSFVTVVVPEEYRAIKEESAGKIEVQRSIIDSLTAKSMTLEGRIDQLESRTREQNRVIETLIDVARVREYE